MRNSGYRPPYFKLPATGYRRLTISEYRHSRLSMRAAEYSHKLTFAGTLKKVSDIAQRQRQSDVYLHAKLNDLRRSFEVRERVFAQFPRAGRLKVGSPDITRQSLKGNASLARYGKSKRERQVRHSRSTGSRHLKNEDVRPRWYSDPACHKARRSWAGSSQTGPPAQLEGLG